MERTRSSRGEQLFEPSEQADSSAVPLAFLEAFTAPGASEQGAGFSGSVKVAELGVLDAGESTLVLEQLAVLGAWVQAQQARVVHRLQKLIEREVEETFKRPDEMLAMSLTAAETGAALSLPHMSAMRLVNVSDNLCTRYPATLAHLSRGRISYRQAEVLLDETESAPAAEQPQFERELLNVAEGRTCAQFIRTARRLRERRWPGSIQERHRSAVDKRGVSLDPRADGMAELTAFIAAEKGQAIFTALTAAARGRRRDGDSRTMDQLRADIFSLLILTPDRPLTPGEGGGSAQPDSESPLSAGDGPLCPGDSCGSTQPGRICAGAEASFPRSVDDSTPDGTEGINPEIMVLIPADTLFGGNNQPAELNGYGPISAEAARRLARQALHWTGLVQDPATGAILAVGRRRKVPAGLKRWLQARDGTCRFPGCSVSAARTEIDHTVPWSQGGPTEHGNLANLCPKHHRYKSLGFWSAHQPAPGVLQWQSTLGRQYRVEPQLDYAREKEREAAGTWGGTMTAEDRVCAGAEVPGPD